MNASLAEYDLPTSMTDESVLGELFGLLDLPRDAVSYRVEQLLLRAIREHRRARAGVAAATVDELMARLNALLVNDTAAVGPTGTPRLGIHEMWSTGAANETMVGVLTEAFNWMEVSAETSDDDAWARLLALTNMTAADEERTLRLEDGSSMLRAAFDAVRKRRALDWKTQQARSLALSSTPPASAATLSPFGRCSRSSLRRCASRTRCSRPTRIRRSS